MSQGTSPQEPGGVLTGTCQEPWECAGRAVGFEPRGRGRQPSLAASRRQSPPWPTMAAGGKKLIGTRCADLRADCSREQYVLREKLPEAIRERPGGGDGGGGGGVANSGCSDDGDGSSVNLARSATHTHSG